MACLALRQASRTCQEATFVCVSSASGCDAVLELQSSQGMNMYMSGAAQLGDVRVQLMLRVSYI